MGKNKRKSSKKAERKIDVSAETRYLERRNMEGDAGSKKKAKTLKFFVDTQGETGGSATKKAKWSSRVLRQDALFVDADKERAKKKIPWEKRMKLPEVGETEEEKQQKKTAKAKRKAELAEARGVYDLWDMDANNGKPRDLEAKLKNGDEGNSWLQHVETVKPKAPRTKMHDTSALPAVELPNSLESFRPNESALAKRVEKAQVAKEKKERRETALEKSMEGVKVKVLATQAQRQAAVQKGMKRMVDDPTRPNEAGYITMPGRSDVGEGEPAAKRARTGGEGAAEGSELDAVADAMLQAKEEDRKDHVASRRAAGKPRDTNSKGKKVIKAQLDHLDELTAQVEKELKEKEEKSKKRLERRVARDATASHRFGTHKFKPQKSTDVEAEKQTASGLRGVTGTSLLQDRMDRYKRRNVVLEKSSRKVSNTRNVRYVERRSRRIPEGLSHEQLVDYISKL